MTKIDPNNLQNNGFPSPEVKSVDIPLPVDGDLAELDNDTDDLTDEQIYAQEVAKLDAEDAAARAARAAAREARRNETKTGFRGFVERPIGKVIVIGATALTVIGLAAGAKTVVDAVSAPRPVAASPANPNTEAPTTSPTPAPSETAQSGPEWNSPSEETAPAELQKYRDMSLEQFQSLDRTEQALYASWLMKDLQNYIAVWKDQNGTANDVYTAPSISNTAGQAIADMIWTKRLALSLNSDDAHKLMSFADWFEANDKDYTKDMKNADVSDRTPRFMSQGSEAPIPTVKSSSDLINLGHDQWTYRDIVTDYGDNVARTPEGLFFTTYTGYDGQPFPGWYDNAM